MPLHIGPCNGDPAVTCGRLKRPEGSRGWIHIPPGEVRKIIDSKCAKRLGIWTRSLEGTGNFVVVVAKFGQ